MSEAKRLRSLEAENAKLKRLLAEAMLDVSTLKEMVGKTSDAQIQEGSGGLGDEGERALAAAGLWSGGDGSAGVPVPVEEAGRRGAAREGVVVNRKRLYRLYREERLVVRKRGGRKRALGTRAPMTIPQGSNQRWSVDFAADALMDGRRFRVLCVIDDFTRECLATVVDNSITGQRVSRELDHIAQRRGGPLLVVSDNVLCEEGRSMIGAQVSDRQFSLAA